MELVEPPCRPDKVVAEARLIATHPDIPNKGGTSIWVGHPYQNDDGQWFCESHVEGFSQPKIPGSSSLEALTGAIFHARLMLESFVHLGYRLYIPELPDLIWPEQVYERLFGLYGYVHASCLKKPSG